MLRDHAQGVDALVRALTSQAGRRATASAKVTLASQSGQYLAWAVPKWVVTGDGEFAGCVDAGDGRHQCAGRSPSCCSCALTPSGRATNTRACWWATTLTQDPGTPQVRDNLSPARKRILRSWRDRGPGPSVCCPPAR